jgi:hypothetical protein
MQCPRCRYENPPQSSFCPECGARLVLACASCGSEVPAGARFCNRCGDPIGALGTLYARTGDGAKAAPHLTAAAALYREMDVRSWLVRAERARASVV